VPDGKGGWRFHFDPGIGMRFAIPLWLDVVLWQVWDKIECPVLILRGEDSDLLAASTVSGMLQRGPAAKAGKVSAVEIPGCGHAPALMDDTQIALIQDFLLAGPPGARAGDVKRSRATPVR
jgi:pimeloyl-ACP methyl ester carboxylesterase